MAASRLCYLDPATGGFFLQIVFAVVAGMAVFLRLIWGRLMGVYYRLTGRGRADTEDAVDPDSERW